MKKSMFPNAAIVLMAGFLSACGNGGNTSQTTSNQSSKEIGYQVIECPYRVKGEVFTCGQMTVPENYDVSNGQYVSLPVITLPSYSQSPKADPIVYLNGGPGASSIGDLSFLIKEFSEFRKDRDVIIAEHRGTSASDPALLCAEDPELILKCHSDFREAGVDLSQYNNVNTARDFEELRKALGIREWNLFGISYGTTLGMYIMRAHPEGVRSVILDSPTAPGTDIARADMTSQLRGIDRMFNVCSADLACKARYGDLRQAFLDEIGALIEEPMMFKSPVLLDLMGDGLNAADLALTVAGYLQSSSSMSVVPAFIDAVKKRDEDALVAILNVLQSEGSRSTSPELEGFEYPENSPIGLTLSIYCGELHYSKFEEGPTKPFPDWSSKVWQLLEPEYYTACKAGLWPIEPIDHTLMDTVVSNVPTLILTGEMDPITNVDEARRSSAGLSQFQSIVVPANTHGLILNQCSRDIMQQFLDDPVNSVDERCLADIPPISYRTEF